MDTVAALDAVRAHVRRAGSPMIIAIDGRSGSGKSTFADLVVADVQRTGRSVTLLRMDAVYPGWHGLGTAVQTLVTDLLPLLAAGRDASYRSWLWTKDRPGPVRRVAAAEVVVVEGVGSGARAGRGLLDCLVWLEAPTPVRYARAMARDGDTYAPHWETWAAQEDAHFAQDPTVAAAHVMVRSGVDA